MYLLMNGFDLLITVFGQRQIVQCDTTTDFDNGIGNLKNHSTRHWQSDA
jgi:hypothetical protein